MEGAPLPTGSEGSQRGGLNPNIFSREQFENNFGASQEDLEKVAEYARSRGLQVSEMDAARRWVIARGTAAQMQAAFGVQLNVYARGDEQWRGRKGQVHVPAELEGVIIGVFGLDNRKVGGRNVSAPAAIGNLSPADVARLYNFPAGVTGAGQTIGILEMGGGYRQSDVADYFRSLGMAAPTLVDVSIDGATNSPGDDGADAEVLLDICVAGAVAPGAQIAVYFAPQSLQGWVDAITKAIHPGAGDPTPSVLSISWYVTNGDDADTLRAEGIPTAEIDEISAAFQDAMLLGKQGPAIFVASGDTGSDSKRGDGKAHVQYPASDPWVTCCGGTAISNVSGNSFDETTWNDVWQGEPGATGGGVSYYFDPPAWQSGARVPVSANGDGRRGRGIPDIAGNASPNSGYLMSLNGTQFPGAGTSAVAPLYAGLGALLNAALGGRTGFLNERLYALGAASRVFRDVNDGGTNALNGAPGYSSGAGWDACTGWGSINGTALLQALRAGAANSE